MDVIDTYNEGWKKFHTTVPHVWQTSRRRFKRSLSRPSRRLIWRAIPLSESSRVLEEGTGGGSLGLAVALKSGARVYAMDIAFEALRTCVTNARLLLRGNASARFTLVAGDIFSLPFRDESFDLMMSEGLVEHFDSSARHAILLESRRRLKKGGHLLLLIPNNEHPLTLWWKRRGYPWLDERSPVREYLIGPNELVRDLATCGFEVIHKDGENPWSTLAKHPNWFLLRAAASILNRSFPLPHSLRLKFGIDAYVLGKKPLEGATV